MDGCLLWGSRVIAPPPGHAAVLTQLHECHPGNNRMKGLARAYVWWPKINEEIEVLVRSCSTCQLNKPNPAKTPLHPWEYPKRPQTRLHIDHTVPVHSQTLLILVDAFSKWIDAHIVPSTSTESTFKVLRLVFAIHGIPEQLVSDNVTFFTSHDFKTFLQENSIQHSYTAPYHPSSNELVERAIQGIAKLDGPLPQHLS